MYRAQDVVCDSELCIYENSKAQSWVTLPCCVWLRKVLIILPNTKYRSSTIVLCDILHYISPVSISHREADEVREASLNNVIMYNNIIPKRNNKFKTKKDLFLIR
jgi:hypothetical protein